MSSSEKSSGERKGAGPVESPHVKGKNFKNENNDEIILKPNMKVGTSGFKKPSEGKDYEPDITLNVSNENNKYKK